MRMLAVLAVVMTMALSVTGADADDIRVFTTGAPKHVVEVLAQTYAAKGGHKIILTQDTAGGLRKRMEEGFQADIVVATPVVLDALAVSGQVVKGTRLDFARTGVGVGVKEGLVKPDISTVESFKAAVIAARAVALPDPKAGGTSAAYIEAMLKKLDIAELVHKKVRYQAGGFAADLVASGEADLVIHQISEIRPVKGVTYVGPLPKEIESVTTYSAALATSGEKNAVARGLLDVFATLEARKVVEEHSMDPVR
ncbi:MAG: substrate-binding domain-containing protein [Hyphomicrobiales bacterium]|nr:substrate-binding domain-containing protein [Hyphomicrobiales bacterium]OQW84885.1 MAG: hypothetical protein BVN31_02180 [Proteobacteria bacterium ST_bin15]